MSEKRLLRLTKKSDIDITKNELVTLDPYAHIEDDIIDVPDNEIIDLMDLHKEEVDKTDSLNALDTLIKKIDNKVVVNNPKSYGVQPYNHEDDDLFDDGPKDINPYYDQDMIINTEPGKLTKFVPKDDEAFYEHRFNEPVKLIKEILQETNDAVDIVNEDIEFMRQNRHRIANKAYTDHIGNKIQLIKMKLDIEKELKDVYTKVSDLELKREKAIKDSQASASDFDSMDDLRKLDLFYDVMMDHDIPRPPINHNRDVSRDLYERINELEQEGVIEYTDNEIAFQYGSVQNGDVEIAILKTSPKKWEFIAFDNQGNEISDYPFPDKRSVGNITWDRENGTARDKINNVYRVIEPEDGFYDNEAYYEDTVVDHNSYYDDDYEGEGIPEDYDNE